MNKIPISKLKEIQDKTDKSWSKEDIEYLIKLREAGIKVSTIIKENIFPNRTRHAVEQKVSSLGLGGINAETTEKK